MIYSFENSVFKDKETGLYSEAYFMEVFHREWHRMIRAHHALSVLIIHPNLDINKPKGLQQYVNLAHLLNDSTKRTTDLVSRFHNNEFIIGLFDLTPDGTTTIIERILSSIKQSDSGTLVQAKNAFIGGLNVYPSSNVDIGNVLQEAETIAGMQSRNSQTESHYELRLHEVH